MSGERKIAVWPDGTWCDLGAIEQHAYRGDDVRIIVVHELMADDEVDDCALMAANGASDDVITEHVVYWRGP